WSDIAGEECGADAKGRRFLYQRCWIEHDGSPMASLSDLEDRKTIRKWDEPQLPFDHVLGLDISADGRRIAYGTDITTPRDTDPPIRFRDGFVSVFDTTTGKVRFCTDQPEPRNYGSVPAVAITDDGKRVVACTKIGIVVLDGDSGAELCHWRPEPRVDLKTL